jgi:hypothetical protein
MAAFPDERTSHLAALRFRVTIRHARQQSVPKVHCPPANCHTFLKDDEARRLATFASAAFFALNRKTVRTSSREIGVHGMPGNRASVTPSFNE